MKISLYDLTYHYLQKFVEDATNQEKKEVMDGFASLLDKGWTVEDIGANIKRMQDTIESDIDIQSLFRGKKKRDENLLKTETFYWHPQLRIMPGAPQRIVDYDLGTITKVQEDHYLEMKASYTLDDLYAYYVRQHGEPETTGEVKKFKGALRYLVTQYAIDTILFMVDASANYITAEDRKPLNSPLDMADYLRDATNAMGEKITEERTAGDDIIVPRQRVPLHRSGS